MLKSPPDPIEGENDEKGIKKLVALATPVGIAIFAKEALAASVYTSKLIVPEISVLFIVNKKPSSEPPFVLSIVVSSVVVSPSAPSQINSPFPEVSAESPKI
ncbi:MAG: hypothetical protein COA88_05235 [Kordia sp.]|nr:MAG: hypothetical protein COA88_05235 [Kordia sp.]